MTLSSRALRSGFWMMLAHGIVIAILFVRTVVLARLLPVEIFGVYALGSALVAFASVIARGGMDGALLHHSPETDRLDEAAPVHFTLQIMLSVCVLGSVAALSLGFAHGVLLTALLALSAARLVLAFTYTPQVLLYRRVSHERIAALHVSRASITTTVSIVLAIHGASLWSLLAIDLAASVTACAFFYGWRPIWNPRLLWRMDIARYFVRFGWRNLLGQLLQQAWRRVDKLVTGAFLGAGELGFYARAYAYGQEPNALAYRPLEQVVAGTLASLKHDRERLSFVVGNVSSLLFRATCCIAGAVFLAAPELVTLFIGEKWLPMVPPFRLLVLTFALSPLATTLGHLAIAQGRPGLLVHTHLITLLVLVCGMVLLVPTAGVMGVAASVSASMVAGLVALWFFTRGHIDLQLAPVVLAPIVALTAGIVGGSAILGLIPLDQALWVLACIKLLSFFVIYFALLGMIEGRQLASRMRWLFDAWRKADPIGAGARAVPDHPDRQME